MAYTGTLVSPKTGFEYPVEFTGEGEPTEADINEVIAELARRESDTLRGPGEAAASSFVRGLTGIATSAVKGAGAVASLVPGAGGIAEDLTYSGTEAQRLVEEEFPVNPIYADKFITRAPEALGQGVGFVGAAIASGGAVAIPLTLGGLAGASQGADLASELDLTGLRRAGTILGYGAVETAVEAIGGPGSRSFLKPLLGEALGKRVVKDVAKEAGEEPATGFFQDLVRDAAVLGTGKEMVNPFRPKERFDELIYGAIGASPTGGVSYLHHRKEAEWFNSLTPEQQVIARMTPEEREAIRNAPPDAQPLVTSVIAGANATPGSPAIATPDEADDITTLRYEGMASDVMNDPDTVDDADAIAKITQRLIDDAGLEQDEAAAIANKMVSSAAPAAAAAAAAPITPAEEPPAVEATAAAPADQTGAAAADLGASATGTGTGSTAQPVSVGEDISGTPTSATGEIGVPDEEVIERAKGLYPSTTELPETPLTPEEVEAQLQERGLPPGRVHVFDRPDIEAEGFEHQGRIFINAARATPETIDKTLDHEVVHKVEELEETKADVAEILKTVPEEEMNDLTDRLKKSGYRPEQLPSEQAAVLISQMAGRFRGRPAFQRIVQKVKTYFKETFGRTLNDRDAEVIAARVVARGIKALQAEGPPAATTGGIRAALPREGIRDISRQFDERQAFVGANRAEVLDRFDTISRELLDRPSRLGYEPAEKWMIEHLGRVRERLAAGVHNAVPRRGVRSRMDDLTRPLSEAGAPIYREGYETHREAYDKAARRVRDVAARALGETDIQFSLPQPQTDMQHAAAEARGDVAEGQLLVDERAKAAGFTEGPAQHRTQSETLEGNAFDLKRAGSSGGGRIDFHRPAIYFAIPSEKTKDLLAKMEAKGFPPPYGGKVVNAYLKLDKEADFYQKEPNGTEIFGITDPARIKSADPFTYDADGKLIPLSKRFDPQQSDIRFSLPQQQGQFASTPQTTADEQYIDAVGRNDTTKTKQLIDARAQEAGWDTGLGSGWFQGFPSSPGTVYKKGLRNLNIQRGEDESNKFGFFFTDTERIADRYAGFSGDVRNVYLKGNFLDLTEFDPFDASGAAARLNEVFAKGEVPLFDPDFYEGDQIWAIPYLSGEAFAKLLKRNGYDGIKFREANGFMESETTAVLEPNQIKSAEPVVRNDAGKVLLPSQRFTESPDIRFSRPLPPQTDAAARRRAKLRIRMTREALTQAAFEQESFKDWYDTHEEILDEFFGDDRELFKDMLSVTSQNATVQSNVTHALKAYGQWIRGEPFKGYLPSVEKALERLREGAAAGASAGLKIGEFLRANRGDKAAVVVDMHVASMLFGVKKPSPAQIQKAKKVVTEIAAEIGWTPSQVQAALWAANIVRTGKTPITYAQYLKKLEAAGGIESRIGATPGRDRGGAGPGGRGRYSPAGSEATGAVGRAGGIKFARPLPGTPAPGAAPTPTRGARARTQVFGKQLGPEEEPGFMTPVREVIQAVFFDSTGPVSTARTAEVENWIARLLDPVVGKEVAQEISDAIPNPEDKNLGVGVFQTELMNYATKHMGTTGDTTLFDYLNENLNRIVIDDAGNTYRKLGKTMAGRAYPLSGFMSAVKDVADSKEEAITKTLPEGVIAEIEDAIENTKVDEEDVAGVGTKPTKAGTSVEELVEEAIPVVPRKKKSDRTILKEILAEPETEEEEEVEPEPEPEPEAAPGEPAAAAEEMPPETPGEVVAPSAPDMEFIPKEKFGAGIIKYADERAAKIREDIRKMLSTRMSTGVDPSVLVLAVEYGGLKLLKGAIKFSQWAIEMRDELGEWVDDIDMIDVWHQANQKIRKFEKTVATPKPPTTPATPAAPATGAKKPSRKRKATTAAPAAPAAPEAEEAPEESDEEAEAAAAEDEEPPEVSREDRTAQSYVDKVDESQVEFLKPESIPDPILKYIREQEDPPSTQPKDDFTQRVTEGLMDLGVSEDLARNTAERVWLRKEAIRDTRVRKTEKAQKEATTKAAQSFISSFDKSQTEVLIPKKEQNAASKILNSAQKKTDDITKDEFVAAVRDELINVGVEKPVAVNAASRAWDARNIRIARAKARNAKRAEARAVATADKILAEFARTGAVPTKAVNPVRAAVRKAMSPKNRFVKSAFASELVKLGVDPATASKLADAVEARKEANFITASAEMAEDLAKGDKGSLKPLEDKLLGATARQQRNPAFRKEMMITYFTQLGLTTKQAEAAARLYDKEFSERLDEAIKNAIDRQAKTSAPWQKKMRKPLLSEASKARMNRDLERVKKAIRSGLLDPARNWKNELAKENGWTGFTPEQYKRMAEIDDELNRPDIMAYESARLLGEMNDIVGRAKIPENWRGQVVASYVSSVLSGLSTVTVQLSPHIGMIRDFFGDFLTDPVIASKAFASAIGDVGGETAFALKNNVYSHQMPEHMQGHEQSLKRIMEQGIKLLESKNPVQKALGFWKVFVGAQLYSARLLNSLDQGFITSAQVYKTTLFTHRGLQRRLKMTRDQSAALIEEAMRAKAEAIENATEKGFSSREAIVRGNEIFLKEMYERVYKLGPEGEELAKDVKVGAQKDAVGTVGRLSGKIMDPKGTALLSDEVSPTRLDEGGGGEGFLSTPINAVIEGINQYLLAKGGTEALKARMMFGFITIPFRTARWYAGYTPYGFVRYLNHLRYEREGSKPSPYQQSYGTEPQVRQRLREATLGTILGITAAAFASATGDDDPEKDEPFKFFITGKGPRDKTLRDAWMKRFKPYALVVKVGKSYVPLNLGRAFESIGWPLAFAGALDDINTKQKGQEARNPLKDFKFAPEIFGAYFGALTQRSSFQGLTKAAQVGEGVNTERTAYDVANLAIFNASGAIPWKGAINSITRLFTNPIDRNSITGAIFANTPIIGPFRGRPALNTFADPMGDQTLAGRLYSAGVPVTVRFPVNVPDKRAYDVVMQKGRGPAPARRNDLEKIYGEVTDQQFYDFSAIRGRALKKAMAANADKLLAMDQEDYGDWVENISRATNPTAAKAVGLVKPSKKQAK